MSASPDVAETGAPLAGVVTDFLRRHPPFDAMEPDALALIATRARLTYHAQDSVIRGPMHGEADALFIIQHGSVRVRHGTDGSNRGDQCIVLREGEYFPVGALLERRPVASEYVAASDAFCYQVSRADFIELMGRSGHFHGYCTGYLASLLVESRRRLQLESAGSVHEQQTMNAPLRTLLKRSPVTCRHDTPIASALAAMRDEKVGSIVVIDAGRRPIGIFTRSDVLERVALGRADPDMAIESVMTPDPASLPVTATGHDAAVAMAAAGCRHLLLIDEGALAGVITERDLFALQRTSMRHINRTIAAAGDARALEQAARDIRALAGNMLGQGVSAEQTTAIISALNDALTVRVLKLESAHHQIEHVPWCWLSFGSEGRHEQTLSSDQDNGLMFECPPGEEHAAIHARMVAFGRSVNATLDRCGFPLCAGNIMAGNPELCLTLAEWRAKFGDWIRNPSPQTLLNASIFFDLRALHGAFGLADALHDTLLELAQQHAGFLRMLAESALRSVPPLGVLREFIVDDDGAHAHTIDLKGNGARLFVDAARVFALAHGVRATSTAQRLRHAGARMRLPEHEIAAAIESFHFIQQLRLAPRREASGSAVAPNRVDPYSLNPVDRRILKEAFRQARALQSRLALDYRL